jgi:hypothetical protein
MAKSHICNFCGKEFIGGGVFILNPYQDIELCGQACAKKFDERAAEERKIAKSLFEQRRKNIEAFKKASFEEKQKIVDDLIKKISDWPKVSE